MRSSAHRRRALGTALAVALTALSAAGCSSGEEGDAAGIDALVVESEHGATSATVHADRVAQGKNSLDVAFDPASTKLTAATLFMPIHGHGSPSPTIERTDAGFRLDDVIFNMAGTWDVTLVVEVGETSDQVEFTVDVP